MLYVQLVKLQDLSSEQLQIWSEIQEADPTLDSPYFRPEFAQEVAAVRKDVEVAVLGLHGQPVGFFPFQRGLFNIGRPVGGILSDFQGAIVGADVGWHAEDLVRRCRLAAWDFNHLLASQKPFAAHQSASAPSPFLDLSAGFGVYRAERLQRGSSTLTEVARRRRKAERDIGPVRFEAQATASEALGKLVEWKTDQYRRTGTTNVLAYRWTLPLLRRILERRSPSFSGMLSTLHVGDRLAAVHLGMRSLGVLHWWFPAYNPALGKYSPGLILLTELAQAAQELGIRRIDLGKGTERYKTSLMSGATTLCEGSVECSRLVRAIRHGWRRTSRRIRFSPLHPAAKVTVLALRSLRTPSGTTAERSGG